MAYSAAILGIALMLISYGDAVPFTNRSNASNSTTVTSTQGGTPCGQLIINNNIEGGRDGPQGPRGQAGPTGPPGPAGPPGGGLSYTRWGRTTCPTTQGTQLVYEGAVVGSKHNEAGSAEYLCLHNEPEFLQYTAGLQTYRGRLYGTEYDMRTNPPAFGNMHRQDAPCSVCYTPSRSTKIIIPGRISCPSSWTKEYHGYLMSAIHYTSHKSRVPICVDISPEAVAGSAPHTVKSLLYFLETTCTGIKCPPYVNGAEVSCVVCTK